MLGKTPDGYMHTREPRPEWVERLHQIAPNHGQIGWLKLEWEPGDPWQPVQRWVVWQMRPKTIRHHETKKDVPCIPAIVQASLEGPSPRETGHPCFPGWCLCARHKYRWVDGPERTGMGIDYKTWQLYRDTGCYGQRYWVIQGTKGGHRYRLSRAESKLMEARRLPAETPAPGDLPYAEPDERTWGQLIARDKLRQHKELAEFLYRHPREVAAEDAETVRKAAEEYADWLSGQVSEAADHLYSWLRRTPELPRAAGAVRGVDADRTHESLVRTLADL